MTLKEKLLSCGPWYHYFDFKKENILTGYYPDYPDLFEKYSGIYFLDELDDYEKRIIKDQYRKFTFSPRQFMLHKVIENFSPSIQDKEINVLDIGCCDGMKTIDITKRIKANVLGVDIREDSIKRAEFASEYFKDSLIGSTSYKYIDTSADKQEFSKRFKNKFDVVCSFGVLHHLLDHKMHLKNLVKLSKGIIVLHSAHQSEFVIDEDKSRQIFKLIINSTKYKIKNLFKEKLPYRKKHAFKSVSGERTIPLSSNFIINEMYASGCSLVLKIPYHNSLWDQDYSNGMSYLVGIV